MQTIELLFFLANERVELNILKISSLIEMT